MANYLQFGQGLMKHLPTAAGCTSTVKLSKKGMEVLSKKDPELGIIIDKMTQGATNPILEIAQKAQGNYAIASFKLKNGETLLCKGAYSTSNSTKGIVEKIHVENDDIITTVTKEGEKVISKDVSKSDLGKTVQEKTSEFMTHVRKGNEGYEGEEVLVRKLKNGKIVETTKRSDGTVLTTVTKPDGTWFSRIKSYVTTSLNDEESKALKMIYPNHFDFKRVDKNIKLANQASNGHIVMPKQGRIYATNFEDSKLSNDLLLKYKQRTLYGNPVSSKGRYNYQIEMKNPKMQDKKMIKKYFGYDNKEMTGEKGLSNFFNDGDLTNISRSDFADLVGESKSWRLAPYSFTK